MGCNRKIINSAIQQDPAANSCPTYVHEEVCVQGTVTITPQIVAGEVQSFCLGDPIIGGCGGEVQDSCTFVVGQRICVQVPLAFSAEAAVTPDGIICGTPDIGQCAEDLSCTYSMGFFMNHEDVTNALITEAGGSIYLGTGAGVGLSFEVTTANASAVLNRTITTTPPVPPMPPFANQYKILYAQLLAAKLNVINIASLGGDICDFAITAIANADDFIGSSPEDGQAGAPGVQEPLALFNEGLAFGCPQHCDDEE